MNNYLIYKYVSGNATPQEEQHILEWASKSLKNKERLITTINLWIASNTPNKTGSIEECIKLRKQIDERLKNGESALLPTEWEQITQEIHATVLKTKKTTTIEGGIFIKKRLLIGIAAAVALFFTINLLLFIKNIEKEHNSIIPNTSIIAQNKQESNITQKVMYTDKGVKARVVLPDSSIVWLNSDTRIEFPDKFSENTREVKLIGEAYFEVVKDPLRPMIITNDKKFSVRVLGTTFNLKSYENDRDAQITLYIGKVEILRKDNDNKTHITTLQPNKTVTITPTIIIEDTSKDPQTLSQWRNGKIIFNETPIDEVIKVLERWHGVKIEVEDPVIKDYKFSAVFNSESIVQVMEFLKMVTFIDYKIDNGKVILSKR